MPIIGTCIMPHPPLIMPEVGRGDEQSISATIEACREVSRLIAALKPDTIVVLSPHTTLYSDYFHISPGASAVGDLSRFRAPSLRLQVDYDAELTREISALADAEHLPAGFSGERDPSLDHGTLLPLLFVDAAMGGDKRLSGVKTARIGLSGQDALAHYRLGQLIARAADNLNRRVFVLASGDLSHRLKEDGPYGFDPAGPAFDQEVAETVTSGDFLRFLEMDEIMAESAGECGLGSLRIMSGALDGLAVESELLSYEGPFGVGYGVGFFAVTGSDARRCFADIYRQREQERLSVAQAGEDEYVRLARLSLESYVITGRRAAQPPDLPEELTARRAGVFVSLKKHGRLRGCIGTISPVTDSVAQEILRNAVSAGCEDPRFDEVRPEELPELVYSVDVLAEPEPISGPEQLDVKRYGVIVSHGRRRGLLLPNLEGVDTVAEQIDIARQKAGISPNEPYTLERFEVVRHK